MAIVLSDKKMFGHMNDHPLKYQLLIVEDNPSDMRLFVEAVYHSDLGKAGVVERAYSGEEAIRLLCSGSKVPPYDAVILDLNMPRMRGHEVLKSIRQRASLSNIPVLIMTNSDYRRDIEECLALGADGYFQKPTDFDQLIYFFSCIASACSEQRPVSPSAICKQYKGLTVLEKA